jgi:hypothetical protein
MSQLNQADPGFHGGDAAFHWFIISLTYRPGARKIILGDDITQIHHIVPYE